MRKCHCSPRPGIIERPNNVSVSVFRVSPKTSSKTLKTEQFRPKPINFGQKTNFHRILFQCLDKEYVSVVHCPELCFIVRVVLLFETQNHYLYLYLVNIRIRFPAHHTFTILHTIRSVPNFIGSHSAKIMVPFLPSCPPCPCPCTRSPRECRPLLT